MSQSIWARVEAALQPLSLPLAANVYIAKTSNELPNTYLVYFLVSNPAVQHADDRETLRTYRVQVNLFTRSGLSAMPDVNGAMTAAGFRRGAARELAYDKNTRHFGLAMEFLFLEEE